MTATEVASRGPARPARLARSLRGAALAGAALAGAGAAGALVSVRAAYPPAATRRPTVALTAAKANAAAPPGRRGGTRRQRLGHHRCAQAV